jgi:hypothetical protein
MLVLIQESWPDRPILGGSLAAPQKLAQELRDSPHFYVGLTSLHNQYGTIPNNLPLIHWCPLALTGPSRAPAVHYPRSIEPYVYNHPCVLRAEIMEQALIPMVALIQESWPDRPILGGRLAAPQKLAQEVRDSSTFMLV